LRRRLAESNFETKPIAVMRNLQVVEEHRLAVTRAGLRQGYRNNRAPKWNP
jgi:hypothetical protein